MKLKNQDGFTLIELMIAMMILLVGILGVMKMNLSSVKHNSDAMKYTEASLTGQYQIESMLMADFDTIDTSGTEFTVTNTDDSNIPPGYSVVWSATNETTDLIQINISILDFLGKKRIELNVKKARRF